MREQFGPEFITEKFLKFKFTPTLTFNHHIKSPRIGKSKSNRARHEIDVCVFFFFPFLFCVFKLITIARTVVMILCIVAIVFCLLRISVYACGKEAESNSNWTQNGKTNSKYTQTHTFNESMLWMSLKNWNKWKKNYRCKDIKQKWEKRYQLKSGRISLYLRCMFMCGLQYYILKHLWKSLEKWEKYNNNNEKKTIIVILDSIVTVSQITWANGGGSVDLSLHLCW